MAMWRNFFLLLTFFICGVLWHAPEAHAALILQSYWNLDETSGTRVDSVGSNNLTPINNTPSVTGYDGNAASFPIASSTYLTIADTDSLSTTGSTTFKISMRVKLLSKSGTQVFVGKYDGTGQGEYAVYYEHSYRRFVFSTYSANGLGNHYVLADALGEPQLNTWYLIEVIHDGLANTNVITVNGTYSNVLTGVGKHQDTNAPFRIGAFGTGPSYYAGAVIDEVRFYKAPIETIPANLLGYWKLDEGSGTIAVDSSGNNYTGTLSASPAPSWTTGYVGDGLEFSAQDNQYVDAGSSIPLDSNNWTMAIWYNPTAAPFGSLQRLFSYYGSGPTMWISGNNLSLVHAGSEDFNCQMGFTTGEWAHIAITRSGTHIACYKDGVLTAESNSFNTIFSNTGSVRIGYSTAFGETPYGILDDARIYDAALSAEEIAVLADIAAIPGAPGIPSNLSTQKISTSTVELRWDAPSMGDSPITDYVIQYRNGISGSYTALSHVPSTATSTTLEDLSQDTIYQFRVAAVNSQGVGQFSDPYSFGSVFLQVTVDGTFTHANDYYNGVLGVNQFTTIQEAIDHVTSGSIISVMPGLYVEDLYVDKDVLITGGFVSPENVVIYNPDCTPLITATAHVHFMAVTLAGNDPDHECESPLVDVISGGGISGTGVYFADTNVAINSPAPSKVSISYSAFMNVSTAINVLDSGGYTLLPSNYWGDSSGPYSPTYNPNGHGAAIAGIDTNVDFRGFFVGLYEESEDITTVSNIQTLFSNGGSFVPIRSYLLKAPVTDMTTLYVQEQLKINLGDGHSTIEMWGYPASIFNSGAAIYADDGENFDGTQLQATMGNASAVSNVPGNALVRGVIVAGISGRLLTYDANGDVMTVKLYVGPQYNGKWLGVYRSTILSDDWTTDGLDRSSCYVENGICTIYSYALSNFIATELPPEDQVIYVNSNTGNDANTGRADSPFKTLSHAYDVALDGQQTIDLTGTFNLSDPDESLSEPGTGLLLNKNTILRGQPDASTIIEATDSGTADRIIFTIPDGSQVTLKNLILRNGHATEELTGGAITNNGVLRLDSVIVMNNSADRGGDYHAAGAILTNNGSRLIMSSSTVANNTYTGRLYGAAGVYSHDAEELSITSSIFANNDAESENPGQYPYSYAEIAGAIAVLNTETTSIVNTTITNNTTNSYAGGVYLYRGTTASIINSTIVGNEASLGAGGVIKNSDGSGTLMIQNSILANNIGNGEAQDFYVPDSESADNTTGDHNIIEFSDGKDWSAGSITGDQAELNIDVGPGLNDTTNWVSTIALLEGSIAINAGTTGGSVPLYDARGLFRSGLPDIGAYEYGGVFVAPNNGEEEETPDPDPEANPIPEQVITQSISPHRSGSRRSSTGVTASESRAPSTSVVSAAPVVMTSTVSISRDLQVGLSGADVTGLQKILIAQGFVIPAGPTGYFGAQTKKALAAYQAKNGISPAAGYFGPKTKAFMQTKGILK